MCRKHTLVCYSPCHPKEVVPVYEIVFKFQIKYVSKNRVEDPIRNMRVTMHREGGVYAKHLCDYFAIWFEKYNGFFIVPNDEQKSMRMSLTNKYKDNFNNFNIIL